MPATRRTRSKILRKGCCLAGEQPRWDVRTPLQMSALSTPLACFCSLATRAARQTRADRTGILPALDSSVTVAAAPQGRGHVEGSSRPRVLLGLFVPAAWGVAERTNRSSPSAPAGRLPPQLSSCTMLRPLGLQLTPVLLRSSRFICCTAPPKRLASSSLACTREMPSFMAPAAPPTYVF